MQRRARRPNDRCDCRGSLNSGCHPLPCSEQRMEKAVRTMRFTKRALDSDAQGPAKLERSTRDQPDVHRVDGWAGPFRQSWIDELQSSIHS
jgi:hypothetical protein